MDLYVKCNNRTEAEYVVKYFSDKGCVWYDDGISRVYKDLPKSFKEPVIIYTLSYDKNSNKIGFAYYYYKTYQEDNYIEAKILMRKEKLRKINGYKK